MIKDFTIAILVALFTYLLSAENQLIGEYSIYIALVSAVLGWLTSFLSGKDSKESHDSLVELLESLNQLIDVQNQNTSETANKVDHLCEIEKESATTLGNQISALKDSHEKNSGNTITKVNGVINGMKEAICKELKQSGERTDSLIKNSFKNNTDRTETASQKQLSKLESLIKSIDVQNQRASETIGIINRLCEIEKDGINLIGIQMSALKTAQEDNTGKTISNVNEVINGMKEAICDELRQSGEKTDSLIMNSFKSNTDRVEAASQKQLTRLESLNNKLIDVQNQRASETIGIINRLCEIEKDGINSIGAQMSALKTAQEDNTGKTISSVNEVINGIKEAICDELQQTSTKTDSMIKDALNSNTAHVEAFYEKQSALSDQIESYYSNFNASVISFCNTVEHYEKLCDTVQQEITAIRTNAKLLTETSIENYKSATDIMLTTIDGVKNNMLTAINEMLSSINLSIDANQSTTERIANEIQEKLTNSLKVFSDTTKSQQDAANEAIKQVCTTMADKQTTELKRLEDSISDINYSIKDFNETTQDFKESINESLRTIKEQLEESYENINKESSNQLEEYLSDIQKNINGTLQSLSEDLTDIAMMFTDYDKEKEIIQRLENLCRT